MEELKNEDIDQDNCVMSVYKLNSIINSLKLEDHYTAFLHNMMKLIQNNNSM